MKKSETKIETKHDTPGIKPMIKRKTSDDTPRKGWAEACKTIAKNGDDKLLIPAIFEDETFKDWK